MYIAPPPLNHWQCVVVDQQRNTLIAQSSNSFQAYQQVKNRCIADPIFCNPQAIACRFNGSPQTPSCTVSDNIQRWTATAPYQPCSRAMLLCQQSHSLNLRYNLSCQVVG